MLRSLREGVKGRELASGPDPGEIDLDGCALSVRSVSPGPGDAPIPLLADRGFAFLAYRQNWGEDRKEDHSVTVKTIALRRLAGQQA
jgi:hypothetical protein